MKKLLSVFMAVVLAVGMLPASAYAQAGESSGLHAAVADGLFGTQPADDETLSGQSEEHGSLEAQATGDLQLVGISGDTVNNKTLYVRDGDYVEFTLSVKNNASTSVRFVDIVDSFTYKNGSGEDVSPFYFPARSYVENPDNAATNATYDVDQVIVSQTEGWSDAGYTITAGTTAQIIMGFDAGDLPLGSNNYNFTLGRQHIVYESYQYGDGAYWRNTGTTKLESTYSASIPIPVNVYQQSGAALTVGTGSPGNIAALPSTGIDFGTYSLDGSTLSGSRTIYAVNSSAANVMKDSYSNTTSINATLQLDEDGGASTADAFGFTGGGISGKVTQNLRPKITSGTSTTIDAITSGVTFDATTLIAGTYTTDLLVSTVPHSVGVNGGAVQTSGDYRFPLKVTLTGTNPRLLSRATGLVANPGNGLVELNWKVADGSNEYTTYEIWRREGVETQTDPDKLDWAKYEHIASKVRGSESAMSYVDGEVQNGTTYSYTVIVGQPYHGYAAVTASAQPLSSIETRLFAPDVWATSEQGAVYIGWELDYHYGGDENDGAGMVDHFNIYRDGVLVDQVYQSAVNDSVTYGWHDAGDGTGAQVYGVISHSYSWGATESVSQLYVPYEWQVSAVAPNGVEGYLSEVTDWGTTAEAYGTQPVVLRHTACFDGDSVDGRVWTRLSANVAYELKLWRAEGTTAPSTSGAAYLTTQEKDYSGDGSQPFKFSDTSVAAGKTYTYVAKAYDSEGEESDSYVFRVSTANEADYGSANVSWKVVGATTARMSFTIPEGSSATVYRNNASSKTYPSSTQDQYITYEDNPGTDGTYVYRVDLTTSDITATGRSYTFVRNTATVDTSTLLKIPDAPTLVGRSSGESNVILSWSDASTGGAPEGYHIYRADAGARVEGTYVVRTVSWNGSVTARTQKWGNGRYLTIKDTSTHSLVDGRIDGYEVDFQGDPTLGHLQGLSWDSDSMPHEYWITAYNRAGESVPSKIVTFDTADQDAYGNPIAPVSEADEAPAVPIIDKLWVDWNDESSVSSGFDTVIGGTLRTAFSEGGVGGEVDRWNVAYADTSITPAPTRTLEAYQAASDAQAKLGTSSASPNLSITARTGTKGELGHTVSVSVTAENSKGTATSEAKSISLNSFPRLRAIAGSGAARVEWTDLYDGTSTPDTSVGVTSWEIWRKAAYGVWQNVNTYGGSLGYAGTEKIGSGPQTSYYSFSDTGLDNGWAYEYKVIAKCSDGTQRESVAKEVTPERTAAAEAPGMPQNLTAQVVNGEILLSWDKPTTGGAVGTYELMYEFTYNGKSYWVSANRHVSGDSTSLTYAPSSAGTYRMFVYSYSYVDGERLPDTGNGDTLDEQYPTHSDIVEVTLSDSQISERAKARPTAPVLSATPGAADGTVQLNWAKSGGATYYVVKRVAADYPSMPEVTIATVAEQYSYLDETAEPGVRYRYEVLAYNNYSYTASNGEYVKATGKTRDAQVAEKVEALIDALPAVTDVTVGDTDKVNAVQEVWDTLSDAQKKLVNSAKAQKLADDVARVEELALLAKYSEVAKSVQDLIDALPEKNAVTAEHEAQINAARSAYDNLNIDAKQLVNTTKLLAAESALQAIKQAAADQETANAVITQIGKLKPPENLTLDDRGDVEAARAAYNALTDTQKALVSTEAMTKLQDLEQKLTDLQQESDDRAAAASVIAVVDQLSDYGSWTTDSDFNAKQQLIDNARAAYDALTGTQKTYVTNSADIEAAAAKLLDLRNQKKSEADAAAVSNFEALVNGLPAVDALTLENENAVVAARNAYNNLTDDQKALVTSGVLSSLESHEAKIAALKQAKADQDAADAARPYVQAVQGYEGWTLADLTDENWDKAESAQSKFYSLTPAQQALIENGQAIVDGAFQRLLDLNYIKTVVEAIDKIPDGDAAVLALTDENYQAMMDARTTYDNVDAGLKSLVPDEKKTKLENAEHALDSKRTAAKTSAQNRIAGLPGAAYITVGDAAAVTEARSAFNALLTIDKENMWQYANKLNNCEQALVAAQQQQLEQDYSAAKVTFQGRSSSYLMKGTVATFQTAEARENDRITWSTSDTSVATAAPSLVGAASVETALQDENDLHAASSSGSPDIVVATPRLSLGAMDSGGDESSALITCCKAAESPVQVNVTYTRDGYDFQDGNGPVQLTTVASHDLTVCEVSITNAGNVVYKHSRQLSVQAVPSTLSFTWESSNAEIAPVSSTGLVTGAAKGSGVDITAKSTVDENIAAQVRLDVVAIPLTAVSLSATSFTYNGKQQRPTVTVRCADGVVPASGYSVSWPADTTSVGSKTIAITGVGDYAGALRANYTINATYQSMHRLYNPYSGEHFYTASASERNHLVSVGWRYEGEGWKAPLSGADVYRLYNPYAGDHHYTPSAAERDSLVRVGWRYEGVGWKSGGSTPLYRQYNPYAEVGTHNYTTSKAENDNLVRVGWRAEGVGWYGV